MREWILDILLRSPWFCRKTRERQLRNAASGPPFVHLARPHSGQLVLLYGGMDAYVRGGSICGMGILPFLQVSGLSGRNVTWIRDPYLNNYAQGFGPEYPDVASVAAWHRQHIESLPHVRDVYAIGYSSGGYAALLFGHLLRVKKVWALSPRTSVAERRADAAAKAALQERLAVHNGVTEYEVWYARGNRYDRLFAEGLSGFPRLTLHPHAGHGRTHFLFDKMIRSGEFQALLPPDPGAAVTASSPTAG